MIACGSTSTPPAPASSSAVAAPRPIACAAGLAKITGNAKVQLNIQEIKQAELDAALIAQGVADQLAGRVAFRRAMKRAVQNGPEGRRPRHPGAVLGPPRWLGDEPHRVVPARAGCRCTRCGPTSTTASARPAPPAGRIGVKVWIYRGDILPYKTSAEDKISKRGRHGRRRDRRPGAQEGRRSSHPDSEADEADRGAGREHRRSVHEADPELEKLLDEEEAIERSRPSAQRDPQVPTGTVIDMLMPRKVPSPQAAPRVAPVVSPRVATR